MHGDANSAFAFNLYRQLVKENGDENLFISPFSISVCLSMAMEGARGKTADEMASVLQIPDAQRATFGCFLSGLLKILTRAQNDSASVEIRAEIANLREKLQVLEVREGHASNGVSMGLIKGSAEDANENELNEVVKELSGLLSLVDQFDLAIANALWGEQTYHFRQDFLDSLTSLYGSGAFMLCDFRHNYRSEAIRINQWVSEKIKRKINKPLSEDNLNSSTALVLTNAVFFKGDWKEPFEEYSTWSQPFYCASGEVIITPLMENQCLSVGRYAAFNADGSFFKTPDYIHAYTKKEWIQSSSVNGITDEKDGYPTASGVQVLELPYKGDELSMVLLLPHCIEDLATLEGKLSPTLLRTYMEKLEPRDVKVTLPKFKCKTDLNLNGALNALGMASGFIDPTLGEGADFSGMADMTETMDPLFINLVEHQAIVEVNEEGTEAAAVTATVCDLLCCDFEPTPFVPKFRADHPFIYFILHRKTQTILFLGRMTKPDS